MKLAPTTKMRGGTIEPYQWQADPQWLTKIDILLCQDTPKSADVVYREQFIQLIEEDVSIENHYRISQAKESYLPVQVHDDHTFNAAAPK